MVRKPKMSRWQRLKFANEGRPARQGDPAAPLKVREQRRAIGGIVELPLTVY